MKPTPHASRLHQRQRQRLGRLRADPARGYRENQRPTARRAPREAWRAATGVRRSELRVGNLTASENPRRESVRAATAAVLLWPMATFAGSSLCEVEMPIELAREVAGARDAWRELWPRPAEGFRPLAFQRLQST